MSMDAAGLLQTRHAGSCDMCSGPAAYTRKYSGQTLCMQCFMRSVSRKVAKSISKYEMIKKTDRVIAVAVSGGKDSLALLKILHEIMQKRHNLELVVITIDEGIPGYRDEALGIVSDVCGKMGMQHRVYAYQDLFDVTLQKALDLRDLKAGQEGHAKGLSSCSICGTFRRRAIDIAARDVGADVVATGHNLDDMLQTFMINMLSGDTDKIAWMDPGGARYDVPGTGADVHATTTTTMIPKTATSNTKDTGRAARRIKPFCEMYESEIVYYAFAAGLPFQEEPCPHMNEGIRTSIREFLNSLESERSGIKNSMYASTIRMIRLAHDAATTATIIDEHAAVSPAPLHAHMHRPPLPVQSGTGAKSDTAAATTTLSSSVPVRHKSRTPCVQCGAECSDDKGICSVCGIMAGLARNSNSNSENKNSRL